MKVLFAVSSESISEAIIKRYQKEYKEILSYKNVYYFNAILKEIQKDKTYDRIVISEDLEPFSNNNYDTIDKFIFEKLDSISDEAHDNQGKEASIILICTDRRVKGSSILVKLFGIGVYNALLGNDRSMDEVCKLINRPRNKKEAKIYYRIDSEDVNYKAENENEVSEVEIQNILTHFKKLGRNTAKFSESFNNISSQYTDEQLRIIVNCLPINVKAVLESECERYQELMAVTGKIASVKGMTGATSIEGVAKNEVRTQSIGHAGNIGKPIVIPSAVRNAKGGMKRPAPVATPKATVQAKPAPQAAAEAEEPVKPVQRPVVRQAGQAQVATANASAQPQAASAGRPAVQARPAENANVQRARTMAPTARIPENSAPKAPVVEEDDIIDEDLLPGLDDFEDTPKTVQSPAPEAVEDELDLGILPGFEDEADDLGLDDDLGGNDSLPGLDDDLDLGLDDDLGVEDSLPGLEDDLGNDDLGSDDLDLEDDLGLEDTSSALPGLDDIEETDDLGLDDDLGGDILPGFEEEEEVEDLGVNEDLGSEDVLPGFEDDLESDELGVDDLDLGLEEPATDEDIEVGDDVLVGTDIENDEIGIPGFDDLGVDVDDEPVVEEQRRGRGRPRKTPIGGATVLKPKRGRGRPRKVVEEPEQEELDTLPGLDDFEELGIEDSAEIQAVQESVDSDLDLDLDSDLDTLPGFEDEEAEELGVEDFGSDDELGEDILPGFEDEEVVEDDLGLEEDFEEESSLPGFEDEADDLGLDDDLGADDLGLEDDLGGSLPGFEEELGAEDELSLGDEVLEEEYVEETDDLGLDGDLGEDDDLGLEDDLGAGDEISLGDDFGEDLGVEDNIELGDDLLGEDEILDDDLGLEDDLGTGDLGADDLGLEDDLGAEDLGTDSLGQEEYIDDGLTDADYTDEVTLDGLDDLDADFADDEVLEGEEILDDDLGLEDDLGAGDLGADDLGLEDDLGGLSDDLGGDFVDDGDSLLTDLVDDVDDDEGTLLPGMGFQDEEEPIVPQRRTVRSQRPVNTNDESLESIKPRVDYSMSSLNSLITKDKKIVTFIGTSKNGNSFLVNNLAALFSSLGINTAILDMTKNKNSYFIFTKNEEELRNVAYNSIEKLQNGYAEGVRVDKNLTVYTDVPASGRDYSNAEPILSTLVQSHSLILIDCDYDTDYSYFASCQEMYLVQSMDILTIQPLTAFLRELKTRGILEPEKIRVVINKEMKIHKKVGDKDIIGGLAYYNDPAMSFMTELFNKDTVKAISIPFDMSAYARYLGGIVDCELSLNGYSKQFLSKLKLLGDMVYPLTSKQSYSNKPETTYNPNAFSNSMNDTLSKMRKKY